MKHTTIQLVPRKDKKILDICLFYSVKYDGKVEQLRKATGYSLTEKFLNRTGEGLGRISSKHLDYPFTNVQELQNRYETILDNYFKETGKKPPVSYLKNQLEKTYEVNRKKYNSMLEYYDDFLKYKINKIGSESTLNPYQCLRASLVKFESEGYKITFDALCYDWYYNFTQSLLKTNSNNSVNQRLIGIGAFLYYCTFERDIKLELEKQKHYIKQVKEVLGICVQTFQNWIDLTEDELKFLYVWDCSKIKTFKKEILPYQTVKELFILSSITGMRYSDTHSLNKQHIKLIDNISCIDKVAVKTGSDFKVELSNYAKEILEKYNYDFSWVVYNTYNIKLKKLLKRFFEDYKVHYEKTTGKIFNLMIDYKKKIGKELITESIYKYEMASTHAGRKTFTNILMNKGLPISDIMARTGWKKIEMLNNYGNFERMNISSNNLIELS
jgi:integrase